MKNTFYQILCLLFLLLAPIACKKSSDDSQPAQQSQPTPSTVTADNYNLITVGMSYNQVVALLGNAIGSNATTYTWAADNSFTITIVIVFSNGTVQSKTQTGLISPTPSGSTSTGSTSGGCPASYNGHTVYVGPRGGCYYINSSGNKTYI